MPPTHRSRTSTGPAAKGSQSTISFGSNVTKPITKSTKDISKPLNTTVIAPSTPTAPLITDLGHISSEAAVVAQVSIELKKPKTEAEERAGNVTDVQLRKYWKAREAERRAPRVHQEELSVEEKILRLFDMSSQYGSCIGIARMKRWVRANKLGLSPPIEVLAVLLKEEEKGNAKIERAHVDELMSSKFVVGEV